VRAKKKEDFVPKFLTNHARVPAHTFLVACFYARAPLWVVESFSLHASSHRVHRREERKRALLKEEEEEEEEVDLLRRRHLHITRI